MSVISLERESARELVRQYGLTAADLVVEIGSGSGAFLHSLKDCGVRVLGVEPEMQSMAAAWAAGVDTLAVHFGSGAAEYIREKYGPAKLILARDVKPGTDEFARLVAAGSRCLTPDGVIAILGAGMNAVVDVRPTSESTRRRAA
jgi:predicted TPR repeat methyltransferase